MVTYGEWQPGFTHTLRLKRINAMEWEPTDWTSPHHFPVFRSRGAGRSWADVHGIGYPDWTTSDYLQAHDLVADASLCSWQHARAPHFQQQLWWTEGGFAPVCAPLDDRAWFGGTTGGGRVEVTYAYSPGLFGDEATWDMTLSHTAVALFPQADLDETIYPPNDAWPPDAFDVEVQPGPLALEDIAYHGFDWTPDDADTPDPLVFIRLLRDGESLVDGWWPNRALEDPGNLAPDPTEIASWPRVATPQWDETMSLTDWAYPQATGTGYLGIVVMMPGWLSRPGFASDYLGSGSQGGFLGLPELTLTYRSTPWRWVFQRAPQLRPLRVFPRDDGLAASSAPRAWPPPRSQQRSSRLGPGSYW